MEEEAETDLANLDESLEIESGDETADNEYLDETANPVYDPDQVSRL